MTSLPWSDKGTKTIPVDADKFMLIDSEVAPGPDQNKTTTLAGILSSFTSSEILLAKDQEDLEAEFGSDIIIPDGEAWTVIVLESFTLTKPIKIGLNSFLEFKAASSSTLITYTGTGAMFQNENSANLISTLRVSTIGLFSTGGESIFDIVGAGLWRIEEVNIVKFESVGTIESMFVFIPSTGVFDVNEGLLLVEPQGVEINNYSHAPPSSRPLTHITIISTGNPTVTVDRCSIFNSQADVVFFDPSSGDTSDYTIQNTKGFFDNLFVPGTVFTSADVVLGGGGQARYQTGAAHGYSVGDRVVISGFTTPSYNGTKIVSQVPTGTEFMALVTFVINEFEGTITKAGRDSTDVTVRSVNNIGNPDSMFTGDSGLEIFGSEITVTINTISVPEVITSASWAFSNLERFEIGVNNEGQFNTLDTALRRYSIGYSGTLEKVGGGSVNVGIVLLKNGTEISFNAPHTVNTGKIQISGSDIVELTKDDTLQVAVINYLDTSSIDVSQIGLVVNLA